MKKYYFNAGEFAYVILAKSLYEAVRKLEAVSDKPSAKTRETARETQNSGMLMKVLVWAGIKKPRKEEFKTFELIDVKKV